MKAIKHANKSGNTLEARKPTTAFNSKALNSEPQTLNPLDPKPQNPKRPKALKLNPKRPKPLGLSPTSLTTPQLGNIPYIGFRVAG